ncbi:hypothetical protein FACS1894170_09380 [Planctomycetales bacterium]|nr:hypothetical protein FACS1894170_09380 [Planctomycetales bacterium]
MVEWAMPHQSYALGNTENQTRWGMGETLPNWFTQWQDANSALINAWGDYLPLESRNKQLVAAKKTAFNNYVNLIRQTVVFQMKANAAVTEDDLSQLGFSHRERPSTSQPIAPPTVAPVLQATPKTGQLVLCNLTSPNNGGVLRALVVQQGIKGCVIRWRKIGNDVWETVYSTKMNVRLQFTESQRGDNIELKASFINPRFQEGPESTTMNVFVL